MPIRKSKENKEPKEQQEITASTKELQVLRSRNKRWKLDQDQRSGYVPSTPLIKPITVRPTLMRDSV